MKKADIERLLELEQEKLKRTQGRNVGKDEFFITAIDYQDEIIILRGKIREMSESGIIVVMNPDRAERDGELFELIDILTLKMVIFTINKSEEDILELLEIEGEEEEEDEQIEERNQEEFYED